VRSSGSSSPSTTSPRSSSGTPSAWTAAPGRGPIRRAVLRPWLERAVGRPVVLVDERLTTQQALKTLGDGKLRGQKKKDWEDRIAAVIILSTYLERKRGEAGVHEDD